MLWPIVRVLRHKAASEGGVEDGKPAKVMNLPPAFFAISVAKAFNRVDSQSAYWRNISACSRRDGTGKGISANRSSPQVRDVRCDPENYFFPK